MCTYNQEVCTKIQDMPTPQQDMSDGFQDVYNTVRFRAAKEKTMRISDCQRATVR
jgi:hypothetical protein